MQGGRRGGQNGHTMTMPLPVEPRSADSRLVESRSVEPLSAVPQQAPRLYRNRHGRLLGGVAGALADQLGLRRGLVRLAFVLLSLSAGLGVLLYGAFWIVLRTSSEDEPEGSARSAVQYVVAAVAAAGVLLTNAHTLPLGWWFVPSLLACFGAALLWRQAS